MVEWLGLTIADDECRTTLLARESDSISVGLVDMNNLNGKRIHVESVMQNLRSRGTSMTARNKKSLTNKESS